MGDKKGYDVFLSHNSHDKPAVEALARKLEDEAGVMPFLDKWHLVPGKPWQEALEEALDEAKSCAVFIGPDGISPWENEEMRIALQTRANQPEFRVVPVLLPGATVPELGTLPRFLSRLTWVDFRGAAGLDDVAAFQGLVAGIKGVAPGRAERELPGTPVVVGKLPVKERIKRELRRAGVALSPKEVTGILEDVPHSTVRQEMHQMANEGMLERPGRGYYSLDNLELRATHIRIERKERLEKMGIEVDWLRLKLEEIILRHPRILKYSKGFYARVPLPDGYFAHLSIFGTSLVCLLVYKKPETEYEQCWEKIFISHLDILNARLRRGSLDLLTEEYYKHYIKQIANQMRAVQDFVEQFSLYAEVGHILEQINHAWKEAVAPHLTVV